MNNISVYYGYLLFTLILSSLISYFSINKIISIGQKYNIQDFPNNRKIHKIPKVNLGGFAILLGFITPILFLLFFETTNINYSISTSNVVLILLISVFIFAIGLWDDIKNLSPFSRLFFEFVLATLIFNAGIRIENIDFSFLKFDYIFLQLPYQLSFLITVFWIIAVINAINWLDGLDGQLAINTIISSLTIIVLSIYFKNYSAGFFAASLMGACIGFLPKNLYPSKIIMGDSGSYLIGLLMAILSLICCSYRSSDDAFVLNIWYPFFILILPLADMFIVILNRLRSFKSPFYPDKNHFHHRLLTAGFNNNQINKFVLFFNLAILSLTCSFFYFNKMLFFILVGCSIFTVSKFLKIKT